VAFLFSEEVYKRDRETSAVGRAVGVEATQRPVGESGSGVPAPSDEVRETAADLGEVEN